ncbi:hypothetical protein SAY87_017304 [Trapa incisa]|uniref:Uncharacterized protein n=1 Tax=Trapa incisa TaxID=236973 RepID=A0AAN7L2T5_9MYRT|nr:hypothetical protein SAY87_017304 [Trapa incisa]
MLYLIERAKKCLDFSATVYMIHLLFCMLYGGFPSSITWWVVNGTGLAIMALLGEYLCIRRELREIPITRNRSRIYPRTPNQLPRRHGKHAPSSIESTTDYRNIHYHLHKESKWKNRLSKFLSTVAQEMGTN